MIRILIASTLLAGLVQAQVAPDTLTFERLIAPFEVLDQQGQSYPQPFFGGFNHPRPQLIDLTGDGRMDLAVQEVLDRLIVYQNVGEAGSYNFEWRSDDWLELPIGSWFRFGDLTGNGLPDLIANLPPGRVRLYRNEGTEATPNFVLAAEPLLDTAGQPVIAEDPNVPALADVDGNGRLDLFLGQADRGYIRYYRHTGLDADGLPAFELVTNRWQNIEIYEANPTCDPFQEPVIPPTPDVQLPGGGANSRGTLHGENALALADIDGDGRPDLFWGDFFTPSLYYFQNIGTPQEPQMAFVAPRFPLDDPLTSAGYNAPTFGDVYEDGTLDLVIGIVGGFCSTTANLIDNLYLLQNTGTPTVPAFEEVTGRLIRGVDVGRISMPVLVDLDGNGVLDLLVGSAYNPRAGGPRRGSLFLYRNLGTNEAPRFQLVDDDFLSLDLDFANHYAPALVDLSGDGQLDLVVGTFGGRLFWMRNQSQFGQIAFGDPQPIHDADNRPIRVGQTATPTFADLTGDGLPDMVVGEFRGRVHFFRNVGSPGAPVFNAEPEFLDLNYDFGRFTAPLLTDMTGNGLVDLVVGTEYGGLVVFANVGSPRAPRFDLLARVDTGRAQMAPAAADLTGDGLPDLLVGTRAGGLIFLENRTGR